MKNATAPSTIDRNHSLTGARGGKILAQLETWAYEDRRGIVTDSSGGFVLPSGARRAPDAAWTSRQRLPESLEGFWHVSPEFVVELKSESDRWPVLRAKMREWIDNGAELAWLIDAETKTVEIYRPGAAPEIHRNAVEVAAGAPVDGFVLKLARVWDPIAR